MLNCIWKNILHYISTKSYSSETVSVKCKKQQQIKTQKQELGSIWLIPPQKKILRWTLKNGQTEELMYQTWKATLHLVKVRWRAMVDHKPTFVIKEKNQTLV